MDYPKLVEELRRAGISGRELTRILGMHPNSISNYHARAAVPNHIALIATLLRTGAEAGVSFEGALEEFKRAGRHRSRKGQ
jgi:hypothetical protein